MPIYEYRCASCGFQNEYIQKVSDPVLTVCPTCGKATFNKLVTAAGFQLKGSGWYVTDFKGSGAKPPESKKEPTKDEPAKPDAGKKDAAAPSGGKAAAKDAASPASGTTANAS
jgi:putative FmdB family regulatory protein